MICGLDKRCIKRAMSPVKEYINLPKTRLRATDMVGAGVDAIRTTANSIIPLFD